MDNRYDPEVSDPIIKSWMNANRASVRRSGLGTEDLLQELRICVWKQWNEVSISESYPKSIQAICRVYVGEKIDEHRNSEDILDRPRRRRHFVDGAVPALEDDISINDENDDDRVSLESFSDFVQSKGLSPEENAIVSEYISQLSEPEIIKLRNKL